MSGCCEVGMYMIPTSPPLNPITLPLSTYQRGYAGMPWLGTASAGISGSYKEIFLTSTPTVGTPALNGVGGAQYDRAAQQSQTTNLAGATQLMETFVTNSAYSISFMMDIQGAPVANANPYQNAQLFAADAHWGWGLSAAAEMSQQASIVFDAATQTLTRTAGTDWVADGFTVGQTVYIRRSASNNGFVAVPVSAVSTLVLTFAGGGIVNESALAGANVAVTAGPYYFHVFNYTGAFPMVKFQIQPGVRWIMCRRTSSGNIQVDVDGVPTAAAGIPGVPTALADHVGASGVVAQTNHSSSLLGLDVILYERFTALVSFSDAVRDGYKNYLNATYGRSY